MTDDLADVIREACRPWVFSTRGDLGAGDLEVNGGPERGDSAETWEFYGALAAAVRSHYLALGGVTDEQTEIAVDEAIDTGLDSGEWAGIVGAVRDLAARAVGHACAERDARITELERVRRIERDVIEDAADAWRERAEAAEDERDALRATVERVRAEVDRWHESHFILARGIRAALDGEA